MCTGISPGYDDQTLTLRMAEIESLGTAFTENAHNIACVAAGTLTRLNHVYSDTRVPPFLRHICVTDFCACALVLLCYRPRGPMLEPRKT